jgi:DDE superfamily endonuclease/winged helix-turn-helix protein
LLARLGLTPQKPLQRAYQRDPQAIEKWQRETYPAIARKAKAQVAQVFFWDESGFRADTVHGKTWGVRGQTPVVERPGQRQSVSAASAVTAQGAFWFCVYEGALNGELFVELLKQMMYRRRKPVHLILDSLPAHKRAIVGEYVASTQGRLNCISFRAMRQISIPTSWCGVMSNVPARRGAPCRRARSCARKSRSSSRESRSCPA